MTASPARIVYLHGFNSSPDSRKAQTLLAYCRDRSDIQVEVPALPTDPRAAQATLEALCAEAQALPRLVLGSSLGGFYATWLAQRYALKAALINPAVQPWRYLDGAFLGWHENPYTGERFEVTQEQVAFLADLEVPRLDRPQNFLVLVQTGDEVLDYRHAVEKYRDARVEVEEGGDHAFQDFGRRLPEILRFAGLEPASSL